MDTVYRVELGRGVACFARPPCWVLLIASPSVTVKAGGKVTIPAPVADPQANPNCSGKMEGSASLPKNLPAEVCFSVGIC